MSSENQKLVEALHLQTQAINALVQSNQQVIALLTDVVAGMVDDEVAFDVGTFLDGTPINGR